MKVPPHSTDAEKSVLGAILLNNECVYTAIDMLTPKDFYHAKNQVIFEAMMELAQQNEKVDLVTVTEQLKKRNQLDKVKTTYLAELSSTVPYVSNFEHYARIVKEKSVLRQLIATASKIAEQGYWQNFNDIEEFLSEAQGKILEIDFSNKEEGPVHIKKIANKVVDDLGKIKKGELQGLPTSLTDLDLLTTGYHKKQFILIAARPSMGKTAYALQCAYNVASLNKTVAIFSLEMGREDLVKRLISNTGKIHSHKMKIGALNSDGWVNLVNVANDLSQKKIIIDDKPGATLANIRSKCRRIKAEHGLDMIIVDYLQLIREKAQSREQEVAKVSQGLKNLAKEFDVPVLALSQLSRAVEHSADKRPNLSHLRESGALEQDADIVIFIHRPEYYNADDKPGIAEFIVAKHRNGPIGTVESYFRREFMRFEDYAKDDF